MATLEAPAPTDAAAAAAAAPGTGAATVVLTMPAVVPGPAVAPATAAPAAAPAAAPVVRAPPAGVAPPMMPYMMPPAAGGRPMLPPMGGYPMGAGAGAGAGAGVGAGTVPVVRDRAAGPMVTGGSAALQVQSALANIVTHSASPGELCASYNSLASVAAASPQARTEIRARGGIELVVSGMRAHLAPQNAQMQGAACRALCNITCEDAHNRDKLRTTGALAAVVAALQLPQVADIPGDAGAYIAEGACATLRNACFDNGSNVTAAVECGAPAAIVWALTKYADVAAVCKAGCDALHMSADNGDSSCKAIRDAGALPVLVATVKKHHHAPPVIKAACGAIKYLTFVNMTNRSEFHKLKACDAIAEAMSSNQQVASVQEAGCRALMNLTCALALDLPTPVHMAVIAALKVHGKYATVARAACGAVRNFCARSAANRTECRDALGPIAKAMAIHEKNGEVQRPALHALRNICTLSEANTDRAGDEKCIAPVIAALIGFRKDPTITLAAVSALWVFSFNNSQNHTQIVEGGGAEQVVEVLRAHADREHLAEACLGTLGNVACNEDAAFPHALRKLKAPKLIKTAVKLHKRNPRIQQAGRAALHNIKGTSC